jgi:hypothetical protein
VDASPPRVLYITTLAGPTADTVTEALFDSIDNAILTGVRLAIVRKADERRYDDVISYRRIYNEAHLSVTPTLEELSLYSMRDLRKEIEHAGKTIGKKSKLSLLKPVIFRAGTTEMRVDLELYEPIGMKLLAVKSAGGCGESLDGVLERLRQAAERLASADADRDPIAVTSAEPGGTIKVGTPIVLDGCLSGDPDDDALTWTWKQIAAPKNSSGQEISVLPSSGYPGRKLRFVPEQDGRYEFELEVKQVFGGKLNPTRRVVDVVAPPRAVPGENRIVERVAEPVLLDATQSNPLGGVKRAFRWRQTAGPSVLLDEVTLTTSTGVGSTECKASLCSFTPREIGLYTFDLSVENGPFSDHAQVSILVAPPPLVRVTDIRSMVAGAGFLTEIDGSASHDVIDDHPTFFWSIADPSDPASLFHQDQPRVLFLAEELGSYDVNLRVCARRKLPGQELWSCTTDTATARVRRSWVTLFSTLSLNWSAGDTTGYSRFLSPAVGIVVQPLNMFDNAFLSAISVRITQSVARISLESDTRLGTKLGAARFGGGSTWELGYLPFGPGVAEMLPHAGVYVSPGDQGQYGFVAGASFMLRLRGRLVGLLEGEYRHVWQSGAGPTDPARKSNQVNLGLGLGVRL